MERLQEVMRRKNGQELGVWEASVPDARKGDGAEVSLLGRGAGTPESGPSGVPRWHYAFWREAGLINAAQEPQGGISGQSKHFCSLVSHGVNS